MTPLFDVLSAIGAGDSHLAAAVARLDGAQLVAQCARHGVSAYVAQALRAGKLSLGDAQPALARHERHTIALAIKLRALVHAVLDTLAAQGVTPVLLKGYGLASRIYDDPLCRPGSDVDILVGRDELARVCDALAAALGLHEQRDPSLADVFEEHHHVAMVGKPGVVEVHFRLFSGFGGAIFDGPGLLSRIATSEIDGRPVRFLSPEDEFVYLATHAANHAFTRAVWLVDLQRYLARNPSLDWAVMGERARAAGFGTAVGAALHVIERTLGQALPRDAKIAFPVGAVRARSYDALFSAEQLTSAKLTAGRVTGFLLRVWLSSTPMHGARHLVDGAGRWVRGARARPSSG